MLIFVSNSICKQHICLYIWKQVNYVGVDDVETKPENVITLLETYLRLPQPELVLSFIGGDCYYWNVTDESMFLNSLEKNLQNQSMTYIGKRIMYVTEPVFVRI